MFYVGDPLSILAAETDIIKADKALEQRTLKIS